MTAAACWTMHASAVLAAGAAGGLAVDLLIVLACAGVVAAVLQAVKVSPIPGYLIAGALIGPGAIGLVRDAERIEEISGLAVVLLMFGIGMHLDLHGLRRGAVAVVSVGVASTLASAGLITGVAAAFGVGLPAALAAGMACAMSSTAVVLRVVQERRDLHRAYGRLSFGVLIVQDLLVIAAMALLPVLADWARLGGEGARPAPEGGGLSAMAADAAVTLGAVTLLVFGGRAVLPRVLMAMTRTSPPEVVLVVSSAAALGAAVLCGALGLSPELGAFIAGFLLSATPMRYQLGGQLAPLRDLFMAVLFTSVGLRLNVAAAGELWWVVLLGAAAVMAAKALSIGVSAWAAGVPAATAGQAALGLAQAGEFTLVILAAAAGMGLVTGQAETVAIGVVMVTLILTPALMRAGQLVYPRLLRAPLAPWTRDPAFTDAPPVVRTGDEPDDAAPSPRQPRAVIAGYGPVGRACADRLTLAGVAFTIVELNTQTVRRQMTLGRSIVYGDVTNPEVLESAGVPDADAVLITIPDEEAMLRACREARRLAPGAFIAVRAGVLSRGIQARELGADHVTIAEIATAATMAGEMVSELRRRGLVLDAGADRRAGDAASATPAAS